MDAFLQAALDSPQRVRITGRGHRRGAILLERLVALAFQVVEPPQVDMRPRHQAHVPLIGPRLLSETRSSCLGLTVELSPADLRWLDLTEARLDDIRRQPLPEPEAKPRGRPRKVQRNSE